tara:strand:+ start:410 stop:1150 length:741 start_codon:yes stop_codon:yes gene_type:complete
MTSFGYNTLGFGSFPNRSGYNPTDGGANTLLLIHSSESNGTTGFTDSSSNGFTLTAAGTNPPVHSTAQAKFGDSSIINSAAGSGPNRIHTDNDGSDTGVSGMSVGTGNFTLDWWMYITGETGGNPEVIDYIGHLGGANIQLYWVTGTRKLTYYNLEGTGFTSTNAFSLNTWHHHAFVRSGTNTAKLYLDGVLQGTSTDGQDWGSTAHLNLGGYRTAGLEIDGHIDEFRFSNVARYTSNFTPATAAY